MYTLTQELNNVNIFVILIATISILCSLVGVIIASKFQKKQRKKYKDCIDLINKKENSVLEVKNGLDESEIKNIDSSVNVDMLMNNLYNIYLQLENNLKNLDDNFDGILTGTIKDIYKNKIEICKLKNYSDIIDGVNLINYSITDFSKDKLKFRITMNAFSYKISNNSIVSGSNLEKVEIVVILTFDKIDNNWLISNYEKVYEKKLNS